MDGAPGQGSHLVADSIPVLCVYGRESIDVLSPIPLCLEPINMFSDEDFLKMQQL